MRSNRRDASNVRLIEFEPQFSGAASTRGTTRETFLPFLINFTQINPALGKMGDFATLRFGPKNASRRVVFGHGVGGLDKFANTFIKGAVEHWSTDPRLRHVEFILPTAPTRDMIMFAAGATADVREMLGDAKLPAWFDAGQDASLPNGWRLNREHIAESTTRWGPRRAWASSSRRRESWGVL